MRRWWLLVVVVVGALAVPAAGRVGDVGVDHAPWDRLLRTYVDEEGRVAYRSLAEHDRTTLAEYLGRLAAADVGDATTPDAEAFWINAYNSGVFSAVLAGYTAENVLRRYSIFQRFTFDVAGKARTLHEIEHEILRPRFHDARMHFALVCASSSCPRLRRAAYTSATLDAALDEEARRFVNDPTRNVIDRQAKRLDLSPIFEWFAPDFVRDAGSVRAFVARYVEGEARRAFVRDGDGEPGYRAYDWTLNAQPGQRP
jgi:Protein of unknown function, DUF547